MLEARWTAEIEPLLAGGPSLSALAAANQLVLLARIDSPLGARCDRIRADLAAIALAKMAAARDRKLPVLAWFHAARASSSARS